MRFTLFRAKQRATLLCSLVAHSRHRRHLARLPDVAAQAAFIEDELAKQVWAVRPILDAEERAAARAILEAAT